MKLTNILMFHVRRKNYPGKIDIGKVQLVLPVTNKMKIQASEQLLQDHENQLYLQKSFLNEDEEKYLHAIELKQEKLRMEEQKHKYTLSKLKPPMTTEDHIGQLNLTKRWE